MSDAQILDRGYRRYDGERSGVSGAVRSVAWHTTRSILGLGRRGRHKVFPVIVALVAMVPAVVFISIGVLFGEISEDFRPEYWEFFAFSITAGVLFTAFVAPEAIVRDQRDGMFALYLSTPLTKPTYVLAKSIAVVGTLWLIIGGPAMIAFLGYTSQGLGPDGFLNWLGVAARLVLGGLIVDEAGMSQNLRLLDPLSVPLELPARIFGGRSLEFDSVSTPLVALAAAAWFFVPAGVIAARYRKLSAV